MFSNSCQAVSYTYKNEKCTEISCFHACSSEDFSKTKSMYIMITIVNKNDHFRVHLEKVEEMVNRAHKVKVVPKVHQALLVQVEF